MANAFFVFSALAVLIISFAILTNLYRERRRYEVRLKPNCLLTRHPIVFVTGPRSLFYFRKYWNAYPEVLAEHGYEVFTLHLPWSGEQRRLRMKEFLDQSNKNLKKHHFICDEVTYQELLPLFKPRPQLGSLTLFKNPSAPSSKGPLRMQSCTLSLAYKLHRLQYASSDLPRAEDLGVLSPMATEVLLEKAQKLGEQDFLS